MNEYEDIIPTDVLRLVKQCSIDFQNKAEYKCFQSVYRKVYELQNRAINLWDPRTNCCIWANDVCNLIDEILYEFIWLKSWAEYYKANNKEGSKPSHYYFHANFCADNCITRIDSCRDKIALTVWSYYCFFNPQYRWDVLTYEDIVKKLNSTQEPASRIEPKSLFLNYLNLLNGGSFKRIEDYRNYKIHRLEPYMEIYGAKEFHGIGYLLPRKTIQEIKKFDESLNSQYPNNTKLERQFIKNACYFEGVLYDRITIREQLWNYEDVKIDLENCIFNIIMTVSCVVKELMNREPFNGFTNES